MLRFTANTEFQLTGQFLVASEGDISMEPIVGGTGGGSFSTTIPVWGKNRSKFRPQPIYTPQVAVDTGGTVSGGQVSETLRAKTSGATAQQQSVGGTIETKRDLPAGVYYLRFTNNAGSAAQAIFALEWNEIPG